MKTYLHPTPKLGVMRSAKSERSPRRVRIISCKAFLAEACSGESKSAYIKIKMCQEVVSVYIQSGGRLTDLNPPFSSFSMALRYSRSFSGWSRNSSIRSFVSEYNVSEISLATFSFLSVQLKLDPLGPAKSCPNVVEIHVGLLINVVKCPATVAVNNLTEHRSIIWRTCLQCRHKLNS